MGDYGSHGHCHDCGGTDGHHYNDCIYDGTDGGYSSYTRGGGSGASSGKWWIGYIVALIIGYGINELLGVINYDWIDILAVGELKIMSGWLGCRPCWY